MWQPDLEKVLEKEIIGRRVFGGENSDFLAGPGAKEPEGHFKITAFFDSRLDKDLSFDRLGIGRADPKVLEYLLPQCIKHGDTQCKPFRGWAAVKVSDLKGLKIIPTP